MILLRRGADNGRGALKVAEGCAALARLVRPHRLIQPGLSGPHRLITSVIEREVL